MRNPRERLQAYRGGSISLHLRMQSDLTCGLLQVSTVLPESLAKVLVLLVPALSS